MKVLVTGAQGCIGAWIVKQLLERGIEVLIYDLDPKPARLGLIASSDLVSRVQVETGRIEDTARLKALVKDHDVTHIVHLAAVLMPFCQANPVTGGMIDVIGTLNVFEAARDAGRPVRIVYASSSAVWGPGEGYENRSLSEEDTTRPATHYGVFKQANEGNARAFFTSNGISSIGLRPWTVYGAGRDGGLTADPTIAIKAVALETPFRIRLSGFMDFQYVEDVAEIFVRCLLSPLEGAHVFNLAGEVSQIEAFTELLTRIEPSAARLITNEGPQVPVAFKMDDSQLIAKVGPMPKTPLAEGIRATLDIFRRLRSEGRLSSQLAL